MAFFFYPRTELLLYKHRIYSIDMSLQPDIKPGSPHIHFFMANSDASIINDNVTVHLCETENSSSEEKINPTKRAKCKLTPEQYFQLTNKLTELEQIQYEEHLIYEEINRVNAEKQHLQDLLNILHVMNSNDRMRNTSSRPRQLHKNNSKSRLR